MKSAELFFKKNGEAFMHSSSLTKSNIWIGSPPFLRLKWSHLTAAEKMKFLKEVLDNSKTGIENPVSFKDYGDRLLKNYGFFNWNQLYKDAKLCSIKIEGDEYIFIPTIYDSPHFGYEGVTEEIERINSSAGPDEIILVLQKALEKCR